MATRKSSRSRVGRRADGTIKPGFWLDCRGQMHAASRRRTRKSTRARPPAPPVLSARQRRATARYEASRRQGVLL